MRPSSPFLRLKLQAVIFSLIACIPQTPAIAGDRDSHLTATHFIARLLGFNEREARLIASADYSIDVNDSTQPLPVWNNALRPTASTNSPQGISILGPAARLANNIVRENLQRIERDRVAHSLNTSPEASLAQLVQMRTAVEGSSGDQQLRYVGQYLHALQDAYFHQRLIGTFETSAEPFSPDKGHLQLRRHGGHEVDGVATHFDSALRAFIATRSTLEAVRLNREGQNSSLPDPRQLGIYDISERDLSAQNIRANHGEDMIRLAVAIAGSYEKGDATPQHDRLEVNLKRMWGGLANTSERASSAFSPLLKLNGETDIPGRDIREGPDKTEYDRDPSLLMDPIREPLHIAANGDMQVAAGVAPGGISLSQSAAIAMPIAIDIDSIRYDAANNTVVLSGSGAVHAPTFDAAIFLTAMRLACLKSDPYFSLDPDWSVYEKQFSEALKEMESYADRFAGQLEAGTVAGQAPARTNGIELRGPVVSGFSVFQRDRSLYQSILSRYPALRPRLVFHPEWLRETRLGKILYDADVVLKEFVEGEGALNPARQPAVKNVDRYVSARQFAVANLLRYQLGLSSLEEGDQPLWRVWLDLADDASPGARPPRGKQVPNSETVPPLLAQAANAVDASLRNLGFVLTGVGSADFRPQVVDVSSITDLSNVVPRMFVRGQLNGKDAPAYDPHVSRVATDVGNRFLDYAEYYPELRRLLQVFRAYVAARKIAEAAPGSCIGFDPTESPLLPAEKIDGTLPQIHPYPILSIQAAALKVTAADGSYRTTWSKFVGYSGGVSVSYDKLNQIAGRRTHVVDEVNELTKNRPPDALFWRGGEQSLNAARAAVSLLIDVSDDTSEFSPVTAETYLADLDAELNRTLGKLGVRENKSNRPAPDIGTDNNAGVIPSNSNVTGAAAALQRQNERLISYLYSLAAIAALAVGWSGYATLRMRRALPPVRQGNSLALYAGLRAPLRWLRWPVRPSPTGFRSAPCVEFYRTGNNKSLYRKVILQNQMNGSFVVIDASLAIVTYSRNTQNKLVLNIGGKSSCMLQRNGSRQSLTANARAAFGALPGDVIELPGWEIVFSNS